MTALVVATVALASVGLVACGPKKKVELIYEDPVTNVWTDRPVPPPAAAPAAMPAEDAPPAAAGPAGAPPAPAAPATPPAAPAASSQPQAPAHPPAPGWRSAQPPPAQPQAYPTAPPAAATTVVVPDPNPTTGTTLRRKSGWVRGGYD